MSVPWRTHCSILYSVCNKWPKEIYGRTLLFGIRCITSESSVVRYVSRFGIKYGLMHSVMGRNNLFECQRYGIKVIDYLNMGHFSFRGCSFQRLCTNINYNNVDVDYSVLNLSNECILLIDNQLSSSGLDFFSSCVLHRIYVVRDLDFLTIYFSFFYYHYVEYCH